MAKPQLTLVENTGSWHGRVDGRVVAQTHEVATRHTVQSLPRADQLDLFDAPALPDLRVFVVAMDTVHGRTLQKAVLSNKPRSVIDLRYAARFDQYGSDRDTLFAYFKSVGSYYALDSMPWHDLSARDFMTEGGVQVPRVHHELVELDRGAVMFFVPKPQHASMLIAYLNRMLSAKVKSSWRIEQVG
ncbi:MULTISPECIES: hypothetical protein [Mesorhizobium]|uniref:Uncharacterized protein n=1 Tax=Rhizobium loti TaxID=381 RepID=A0A6M7TYZ3_RHILI|nr:MULTISPECIES: hypothetical protein [Mesorhizobium]KRB23273.1 hypothetical protein ASE05_11575 [Mesorhizobium sp. Root172]OBQ66614.1 hypothetical protein A8145_29750 [Mesorhizobium loti]QKC70379.1 hypothetical protein EB815_15480 [Mesorhizobium loti]